MYVNYFYNRLRFKVVIDKSCRGVTLFSEHSVHHLNSHNGPLTVFLYLARTVVALGLAAPSLSVSTCSPHIFTLFYLQALVSVIQCLEWVYVPLRHLRGSQLMSRTIFAVMVSKQQQDSILLLFVCFIKIILTSLYLVEGLAWWDWPFTWWTDQLLSFSALTLFVGSSDP